MSEFLPARADVAAAGISIRRLVAQHRREASSERSSRVAAEVRVNPRRSVRRVAAIASIVASIVRLGRDEQLLVKGLNPPPSRRVVHRTRYRARTRLMMRV